MLNGLLGARRWETDWLRGTWGDVDPALGRGGPALPRRDGGERPDEVGLGLRGFRGFGFPAEDSFALNRDQGLGSQAFFDPLRFMMGEGNGAFGERLGADRIGNRIEGGLASSPWGLE